MTTSAKIKFGIFSRQLIATGCVWLAVGCTSLPVQTNLGVIDAPLPGQAPVVKATDIAAEYHLTGPDTIAIAARGGEKLQPDLVKKFALLRAAEVTLDTSASRFRIVKLTREDVSRRQPGENKGFAMRLDIQTDRTGQPITSNEAWYSAEKLVEGVGAELKAEFRKLGVQQQ